jgi:uncharacterized membrane protein
MAAEEREPPHTAANEHAAGVAVDRAEEVAYDPYAERRRVAFKVLEAVYLLFSLIEGLLAIRFLLRALGANPSAGFAQFVYAVTAPLLGPFMGLFANPRFGDAVIELDSIIAMLAYALLAWLVGKLVWLIFGETRSALKAVVSSSEAHLVRWGWRCGVHAYRRMPLTTGTTSTIARPAKRP